MRLEAAGDEGTIVCETSSIARGQWARAFGRAAGVNVPLYAAEHFYLVTKAIAGVSSDMPVIRDPDGYLYYKEEVGGLVMGGFEPKAKPWNVDPIPEGFEFQLLPEDWDHFEILMRNAIHRTPCLETAEVKLLLNGPESFTLDGNFILGEAPELAGLSSSAPDSTRRESPTRAAPGKLVAEWIVEGEAPLDLWDVDIRRFAPFHANRRHLADRTVETLGLHYAMRWPREELETVRPLRRSPLYDRLAAKGAVFGSEDGLGARQLLSAAGQRRDRRIRSARRAGSRTCSKSSAPAARTSSSSTRRRSRSSCSRAAMRLPCCSGCARTTSTFPSGRMVYTAMLNARGGFESDLTDRPRRGARVLHHHRVGADDPRLRLDRARDRRERARRARRRHQRLFGDLGDGTEGRSPARPADRRRSVESGDAVLDDADDRRRLRARARGADELRRRAGLRAVRAHRPVRDALRRAVERRRASSD